MGWNSPREPAIDVRMGRIGPFSMDIDSRQNNVLRRKYLHQTPPSRAPTHEVGWYRAARLVTFWKFCEKARCKIELFLTFHGAEAKHYSMTLLKWFSIPFYHGDQFFDGNIFHPRFLQHFSWITVGDGRNFHNFNYVNYWGRNFLFRRWEKLFGRL